MKILLLRPPIGGGQLNTGTESLSLGYIGAVLRRDGHEVEILDPQLAGWNSNDTVREVAARDFDCLAITALHDNKDALISIVRGVRRRKKDALIVAGGYLPSLATRELLAACPEIDFVVRGEGEISAPDVFGRIERGENWRDAPGVAFMSHKELIANPLPPLVQDLDSLPFPVRDTLMRHKTIPQALIASSRGCYHRCTFCCINPLYGLHGNSAPRLRSPENFVDEMESVMSATGMSKFGFVDDNFIGAGNKGKERAVRIAEEVRARNLKIRFSIECRADEVDEDTLKALKEAGLKAVFIGIESGVQRQLDTYKKGTTAESNKRAIEMIRKVGLAIGSGFIIFDPYVTVEELQENLKFIHETGVLRGPIPITKVRLYRGAPLVDRVREDGLLIEKGIDLDYNFKDPRIWMMWKVSLAMEALKKFKWRVTGHQGYVDELEADCPEPVEVSSDSQLVTRT